MTADEFAEEKKAAAVAEAREYLDDAKSGMESPNVFINGCKSKAALVRKRVSELDAIEARDAIEYGDFWNEIVSRTYQSEDIPESFLMALSDYSHGSVPSIREQAKELVQSRGYVLFEDVWKKSQ